MKTKIHNIINSWPMRHKHLLVTLSFAVALIVPVIQEQIPKSYASYTAPVNQEVTLNALLKKYADEEYANMYVEAEIRAATRVFKETGIHAELLNPNN